VIGGYTQILLEKARERGSIAEEDILQRLRSNVLMVHSLITNYLDLSQVEAGHLTLAKKPLAINEILHRVGQQYEAEAQRRDLTLEFHLQQKLPAVDGDALALERLFANLMHNALKFTPKLGRVTVSSAQQDSEVVVMVADSGRGIAPEELPSIFEKYRRAATSQPQEGVGLGLFIAKMLVEAHGGRIEVESTIGSGSCFSVRLPVISADSAEA